MQRPEISRATDATKAIARDLGLETDDAVLISNSNKIGLRLLPCDVFARVARGGREQAAFELALAQQLADVTSDVAALDDRVAPEVHERDGFVVTLWTYYEALAGGPIPPPEYAAALERLHAGMRHVDATTPHFTDRVADALGLLSDHDATPSLADSDRTLLIDTLQRIGRAVAERAPSEQLLHGEPHPGNLLRTDGGLRFIDLETCCRGPVEFDLAHAPEAVHPYYEGADEDLLRECGLLVLAMVTTWRWDRDDQLPNGRRLGAQWLGQLRAALESGPC